MNIPDKVIRAFIKEADSTNFGKVSLCIIRRGSHKHYQIDKQYTIIEDSDVIITDNDNKLPESLADRNNAISTL
jgi:hypothetical protein